jgi:Lsr2
VQIFLIDDLDGTEAAEAVCFGLDGTQYEIDLNSGHAAELRATLAPFAGKARGVGSAKRASHNGSKNPVTISNMEVRAWARSQGIDIKERGRVPAEVVAKYRAATGM